MYGSAMRRSAGVVALVLGLLACSPKATEAPPAAITEVPSLTAPPSTTALTGFEVPEVIDVAYVQRVVDEIYRLTGEAARYAYAIKASDDEFKARMNAIFQGTEFDAVTSAFSSGSPGGFSVFANPPGNPVISISSVVEGTRSCIIARANLDFRPLFIRTEKTPLDGIVQLLTTTQNSSYNPTGWTVVAAGTPALDNEMIGC